MIRYKILSSCFNTGLEEQLNYLNQTLKDNEYIEELQFSTCSEEETELTVFSVLVVIKNNPKQ